MTLAASVLTWFTWFDVYVYYGRMRSNIPNTSSGRVYSLANHGQVFYVTLKERNWLLLLTVVAFVLFFSGYMLDRSVSRFRTQTKERTGTRCSSATPW